MNTPNRRYAGFRNVGTAVPNCRTGGTCEPEYSLDTGVLKEYMTKGFPMNGERLKQGKTAFGTDYFGNC